MPYALCPTRHIEGGGLGECFLNMGTRESLKSLGELEVALRVI